MKFLEKLLVVMLLFALPMLACGEATSTPQVSTSVPADAEQEDAEVEEPEATAPVEEDEPEPTDEPEPEEAPTETPEPQAANLGDLVELEGYSFAAVVLEDPAPPGLLYTPTEGMRLVAVEIIVGNVSGERVTVNSLNSTLLDSEGFTYQSELAGRDDELVLVDLEPGERVRGWVAFEIPEAAEAAIIRYQVKGVPRIVMESRVLSADGATTAGADVPLTAAGPVERDVPGALGELVEGDGYSLMAEVVEDPTTPGILYTAVPGRKLVAVQIVVGNVSGEMVTVNSLNTVLFDTDGFAYTSELAGRDGELELVDLNPGEQVRGWVAFELPEDASPASIKYQVKGFPLIEMQTSLAQ